MVNKVGIIIGITILILLILIGASVTIGLLYSGEKTSGSDSDCYNTGCPDGQSCTEIGCLDCPSCGDTSTGYCSEYCLTSGYCRNCLNDTLCPDCLVVCDSDCSGKECGNDGCGGSCGDCVLPDECIDGECVCPINCEGKECGSDGCGGSCGDCADYGLNYKCVDGKCVEEDDINCDNCPICNCKGECADKCTYSATGRCDDTDCSHVCDRGGSCTISSSTGGKTCLCNL